MATHDIELIEQTVKARTKESVNSLMTLFRRLDPDGLGYFLKSEFVSVLQLHDVQATLSSLSLKVHAVESLFTLIDIDEVGIVEIDEFVMGCLRVRGSAREVDLEIFMQLDGSLEECLGQSPAAPSLCCYPRSARRSAPSSRVQSF